jgi:transposase
MSIRPRLGVEVPELTARVARASNPAGTTAMWVRDRLDGLWEDEDFAGWYPRDGRPGLSPAQLATVCVLQFLLDLSDRDAAEAVRCRIDFKYALGLELDDPGFHHSVLSDFRDRLLEDGRADRLLDPGPGPAERGQAGPRARHPAHRLHPRPGGGAGPDPPGAGHRGDARGPGGACPRRRPRAGRPGRGRAGPPLRPPGPAGQEPHPAEDQDE